MERGNATSGDGQNFTARAEDYRQKNAAILSSWLPWLKPEEVGHRMLPYIRDQILELAKESLLVVLL